MPLYPRVAVCRSLTIGFVMSLVMYATNASAQAQSLAAGRATPGSMCRALRHLSIPASEIGLPTGGARLWSAKLVRHGGEEFCKVLGGIAPIDPQARDIRFEVNLPTAWNGKAVEFGGAIFDGWLHYSNGVGQPVLAPKDVPPPLARGYATFGSDSGHHRPRLFFLQALNLLDASFAANPEERRNYSQDAIKKTHDVAVVIIGRRYGHAPTRMFFLGASAGGHEALTAIQHWPADYDGVLSAYPDWTGVQLGLKFISDSQALYAKGGFLARSNTKLLSRSVLDACDAQDGVRDGLVSNVNACHFDPASLLCSAERKKGCLSAQQLATVKTFAGEQEVAVPLWHGVQTMPGYNVLAGADLTGTLGLFHHPERQPKILLNSFQFVVGSRAMRHFLVHDTDFNTLTFDTSSGGAYAHDLLEASRTFDASDADLSTFAAHGGKLLLIHGTADTIIPTDSTVMYYTMLRSTMGASEVDSFARLFLIPGFGHGMGDFKAGVDALGILDAWLDAGAIKPDLVTEDQSRKGHGRARPLCAYPAFPEFSGAGSSHDSRNFRCSSVGPGGNAQPSVAAGGALLLGTAP